MVAEIAGEGGHVVGGVGEAEHVVTDEVAGGSWTEAAVVVVGSNDGELLNMYHVRWVALNLLTRNEIENEAVEIG